MRTYQKFIIITLFTGLVSLVFAVVLNFAFDNATSMFWSNVFVSVFGGALLTLFTSIIGYLEERRKVLERFYVDTNRIIGEIIKYNRALDLDKKVDFWLTLAYLDKTYWHNGFGDISFFLDDLKITHNRAYIFSEIYKPMCDFLKLVSEHEYHFKYHVENSYFSKVSIEEFVKEIENRLYYENRSEYPVDQSDNGKTVVVKTSYNKFIRDITEELNGRYYDIMYRRKK